MRIMSLNGWGGVLWDALDPYLRSADPDILCLQEVTDTPGTAQDWLTYRDGDHVLPQRANLFRDVRSALPGHSATFCPAAEGLLWDGDTPVRSRWGLATFVRADMPVIAQAQDFVHKDYCPHGYGDHPRSRNAHVVRVWDAAADRALTIAQMHGLRDPRGRGDTPERAAQADRFAALIARVMRPGDGLVGCGDFNLEPGSANFATLAALGLRDLVTASGGTGTRTSHYKKAGRFADYMLVNAAIAVRSFAVVEAPEVSDHRPLVLEV